MSRIQLINVIQDFPKPDGGYTRVIENLNLTIDKIGIFMIFGPSGCGKSTILHMLGGVRPMNIKTPTSGKVLIDGQECNIERDDTIMVFQKYSNRPDLTVYDNVMFPFTLKFWKKTVSKSEAKERVQNMLKAVGLEDKKDLYPSQLSGGQNQRVALARALVLRPKILLLDEPFGALDSQTRTEMQKLLFELYKENPCIMFFVTHDVTEALMLGDKIVLLSTQPATVTDIFDIQEVRPRYKWIHSEEATNLEKRILTQLYNKNGVGQIRVSI